MLMENYMSGYLEDFLNFLSAAEDQLSMSQTDLDEANTDLQDLEHYIEFGKPDAKGMWKVYKLIRNTRVKRRCAKEAIELCSPIVQWADNNRQVLQELRELLGQVRKIERQQANRSYAIRGHILDDVTTLSHLSNKNEVN